MTHPNHKNCAEVFFTDKERARQAITDAVGKMESTLMPLESQPAFFNYAHDIALILYAQAVSKPVGVNDEQQPDYRQIAQDCLTKAQSVTEPFLKAVGILPEEDEA